MVTVFLNLVLSIGWLGRTGDKGKASLLQRAVWHAQKRRVLESRMLSYVNRTCICASMHSWHTKPRARARIVVSLTYHGTQSERKLKRARQSVLFLLDNYLFVAIFADSYYFKLFRSIVSKAVFFIPITHDITLLTFAFCLITFVQLFVVPRERNYLTHRRHAQSQRA